MLYYIGGNRPDPPTSPEVETLIIYNNKKLETRKGMFKKNHKISKKNFKKSGLKSTFLCFFKPSQIMSWKTNKYKLETGFMK